MNPYTIIPAKKEHADRRSYEFDYERTREDADRAYTDGWNACRDAMWRTVQEEYRKTLQADC